MRPQQQLTTLSPARAAAVTELPPSTPSGTTTLPAGSSRAAQRLAYAQAVAHEARQSLALPNRGRKTPIDQDHRTYEDIAMITFKQIAAGMPRPSCAALSSTICSPLSTRHTCRPR